MRFLLGAVVLWLAACGGGGAGSTERQESREATPDPKYMVVRLSDLPGRFSLVAGETIPTRLDSVLGDPWSSGLESVIRRERISGFQTSVWSPERQRIECGVAVYRSSAGASELFGLRTARLRASPLAANHRGQSVPVEKLGDEANAIRFKGRRLDIITVTWRDRNVLAACSTLGSRSSDANSLMKVARAQQKRIALSLR